MIEKIKKILRILCSDISLFIIATAKAFKIKKVSIKNSRIFLEDIWEFFYRLSNLDKNSLITAEGKNLCYYYDCIEGVESFKVDSISNQITLNPGENLTFAVLDYKVFRKMIKIEIIKFRILFFFTSNFESKVYLRKSLNKLLDIYKFKIYSNNDNKIFNQSLLGVIQFYKNHSNNSFNFQYKDSVILTNQKAREDRSIKVEDKKNRLVIVYLDNFSKYTKELVMQQRSRFKCLSDFFNNDSFITLENTMSVSNVTYPAAVSILSGMRYEDHLKYHPTERGYIDLITKFYKTNLQEKYPQLFNSFSLRFRAGNNWRMKQHHGLHSIFTHCFSNQSTFYKVPSQRDDIYKVTSQAIKQLDIASDDSSIHWIDIMDSHHPVKNSILPFGTKYLNPKTLINGLRYESGIKYTKNKHTNSTKEIYLAQIASIDSQLEIILKHSYSYIPRENHTFVFLSDHGTTFMQKGSNISQINELHKPMIGILSNSSNNLFSIEAKEKHFHPSKIFDLINHLSIKKTEKISDKSYLFEDFSYSHIIYPLKPYQLFINVKEEKLYIFSSFEKLPRKILRNESELKILLYKFLRNGTWLSVSKDKEELMEFIDLPKNLKIFVNNLFN
jgi:hypothetical protein